MLEKISSDSESDCIVVATSTVDWEMMKPMMSAREARRGKQDIKSGQPNFIMQFLFPKIASNTTE
jgi:hypothetical protein